jgi:hypothetical protein
MAGVTRLKKARTATPGTNGMTSGSSSPSSRATQTETSTRRSGKAAAHGPKDRSATTSRNYEGSRPCDCPFARSRPTNRSYTTTHASPRKTERISRLSPRLITNECSIELGPLASLVWTLYVAPPSQPVGNCGECSRVRDREDERKPLPWIGHRLRAKFHGKRGLGRGLCELLRLY